MYSFIHLHSKHILNDYYRPDTVLGRHCTSSMRKCQDSEVSLKKFMWVTHKETKKANKHGDVYCEPMNELLRKCGEKNSLFDWGNLKRFPRGETTLSWDVQDEQKLAKRKKWGYIIKAKGENEKYYQ